MPGPHDDDSRREAERREEERRDEQRRQEGQDDIYYISSDGRALPTQEAAIDANVSAEMAKGQKPCQDKAN